jgi:ATP-dependent Clp protease ATP-binding subunit ClpA
MIELDDNLTKRLGELRVKVETPDTDTVLMKGVPTGKGFFNKSTTNLLIKRPRRGMPLVVCVDEDLSYTGSDSGVARAFAAGAIREGWRALYVRASSQDFRRAVEEALRVLGFDGRAPSLLTAPQVEEERSSRLLATFGENLSELASDPTTGREEEAERVAACVMGWQRRMALIVGDAGTGKTNLLYEVARLLNASDCGLKIISVDLAVVFAGTLFESERESLLARLLDEAVEESGAVVAFENAELAARVAPRGALLLVRALDRGARLVGTALTGFVSALEREPLARRLQVVELAEMSLSEAEKVILSLKDSIALHHNVEIVDEMAQAAIDESLRLAGRLPAKAIALLDAASARARLAKEVELSSYYLRAAATSLRQSEA